MPSHERVSLLDTRLDLSQAVAEDDRPRLAGLSLPIVRLEPGRLKLDALLAKHEAFGATVLDGMVMEAVGVGGHTGIHLLGPGDLLLAGLEFRPSWLTPCELRAPTPLRVAMLGNDLLEALYRSPRVVEGLYARVGDQLGRLTAQLVICQLPRVDDRVLSMMWLLADTWGQVTPSGVRVPLALTHETLGALVGARRPTVTLALRKLGQQGAIVQQDSGWLLLVAPPNAGQPETNVLAPHLTAPPRGFWAPDPGPEPNPDPDPDPDPELYAELRETFRRLSEAHRTQRQATRNRLAILQGDRVRMSAARKRIAQDAVRRRQPPSS